MVCPIFIQRKLFNILSILILEQYKNLLHISFLCYFYSRIHSKHFEIEIIWEFVTKKYYKLVVVINIYQLEKY